MKVALVYDRVNKWGGAERVLLALHQMFPKAPLYTSVYDKKVAPWAKVFEVKTSYLQSSSWARSNNDKLALFMPTAFESFDFSGYDLVISVTSEAAKGIITKPGTVHICYCLTPTRYLWSGYDDYFKNKSFRKLSSPAVSYLKKWDMIAAKRPDYFISISDEISKRVKKYYGRKSSVIYPPLMFNAPKTKAKKKKKNYFLLVSRFSRFSYYKKVDLAIEAFNKTGLHLVVVGSGPMMSSLKSKSKDNIRFVGELTDRRLAYYYENCQALIFPGREDFGLVMAEAQHFGAPVIAYKRGGAIEIIKNGKTGLFFGKQTAESLVKALESFSKKSYNEVDIIRNSQRFSYKNFKSEFEEFLKDKI